MALTRQQANLHPRTSRGYIIGAIGIGQTQAARSAHNALPPKWYLRHLQQLTVSYRRQRGFHTRRQQPRHVHIGIGAAIMYPKHTAPNIPTNRSVRTYWLSGGPRISGTLQRPYKWHIHGHTNPLTAGDTSMQAVITPEQRSLTNLHTWDPRGIRNGIHPRNRHLWPIMSQRQGSHLPRRQRSRSNCFFFSTRVYAKSKPAGWSVNPALIRTRD